MGREYSPEQIEYALSVVGYYGGDIRKAATFLQIGPRLLKIWVAQSEATEEVPRPQGNGKRPYPLEELIRLDAKPAFAAAPEIAEWVTSTILQRDAPLFNEEHQHLQTAKIGYFWTNIGYDKQMRRVIGLAELPKAQGNKWAKARAEWYLEQTFGWMPDFLITLDANYAARADDASWCALVEHELYHCAQRINLWGEPATNFDGKPLYCMRGHDAEEFIGVVRRYGVGASTGGVRQLVEAARHKPLIARARIGSACGTCLRAA